MARNPVDGQPQRGQSQRGHRKPPARASSRPVAMAPSVTSQPGGDTHAGHFGRFGEACAERWYLAKGCRILATNWRCREGELDLVVADGSELVFVEVKARSSGRFGSGAEAVTARKQQRLRMLAGRWLAAGDERSKSSRFTDFRFTDIRFDVVDVDARGTLQVYEGCF